VVALAVALVAAEAAEAVGAVGAVAALLCPSVSLQQLWLWPLSMDSPKRAR